MTFDPHSATCAATVRAVLLQLDIAAHPWRIVPIPEPVADDTLGVHVEGVATVYVAASTVDEAAVGLADQLQEHMVDIERRAVPECLPGHPHPPNAELVNDRAAWVCPKLGTTVRPIIGTDNLQLDIDVRGAGWLDAAIRHDGQELRFRASYVGDALLDLGEATVAIVGQSGEPDRSLVWVNEPGYRRWDLARENDLVRVAIVFVTECEASADLKDGDALQFDNRGTPRFEAHVPTRALVAAVLDALDNVLRTFGAAEFDIDWDLSQIGVPRHFPYIDYVRLRELLLRTEQAAS